MRFDDACRSRRLLVERPFKYGWTEREGGAVADEVRTAEVIRLEEAAEPIRSPFYDLQAEMGATFMEEAGWYWTEGFGDVRGEHRAVRQDLGLWDVSPLNKWELRGPDALVAAHVVHAGDVLGLQDGQVRYGPFCDADGLMVDDGTVFRFSNELVWVMTNGADHAEHFARATEGLRVEIEHLGTSLPHLGLLGPRARDALAPICDAEVGALGYFHFVPTPVHVGGVPCVLSRTGFGGELGYELFCSPEDAEDLWTAVLRHTGARPFGVEAVEILRIEAGLIILDYDYQAHAVTPFDVGLGKLVCLEGADFLGRDALRRVADDPPNRWVTLRLVTDVLPEYGAPVTVDGEAVGNLTSPTDSPLFGPIGVAILDAAFAGQGTAVEVALTDGTAPATVAPAPIYDTEKRRPRS
jgi:aminomethyltransferase